MKTFKELNLSAPLLKSIEELGFETPSPIQAAAFEYLLGEPTDFMGLAATGTGKTAAFSIPLLEKIDADERSVQALVLCPTRELAIQVAGQINILGKYKKITAVPIYGGASYNDQIRGIRMGAQVVVGTPGRVVDHLDRKTLSLEGLNILILDEADEMISMGFKDSLEAILNAVPNEDAKTWLFSATMSPEVRRVSQEYLVNPKHVQINKTEVLSATVEQIYYSTQESNKPEVLCKLMDAADDFYGLIFCQTKALVIELTQYIKGRGYQVDCLHGDMDQAARDRTMKAFRDHKISVLICTDVACRGLDVKDVTHVINYSLPRELDNYVHRIGRTARSGKTGYAMSLVTPSHRGLIARIEQMTKSRFKEGSIPNRKDIASKKIAQLLTKFQDQKNYTKAIELLNEPWKTALTEMPKEEIVARFLSLTYSDIFQDRDEIPKMAGPALSQGRSEGGYSQGRPERGNSYRSDRGGGGSGRFGRNDSRGESRGGYGDRRPGRDFAPRGSVAPRREFSAPRPARDEFSAPREKPAPKAVSGEFVPEAGAKPLTVSKLFGAKKPFEKKTSSERPEFRKPEQKKSGPVTYDFPEKSSPWKPKKFSKKNSEKSTESEM